MRCSAPNITRTIPMEHLLHYVWKHKIFPLESLHTHTGEPVEVIDPGLPNTNAGPDFFNAKLKIGGTMWVGNVEIHTLSSDWQKHGHHNDGAYDNVILHVVEEMDCVVSRPNGQPLPHLQLSCPEHVRRRYDELRRTPVSPPCFDVLSRLPRLTVHSWLTALQSERLEQKTQLLHERLQRHNRHWEDVFFITLARNFGFGLNGDAFEYWANRLPFRAIDKHRDNLFQVEAFFFGTAGLLEEEMPPEETYFHKLRNEYAYLCKKFSLPAPMEVSRWKFLRSRPQNFPHIRIAQLASLYHKERSLFSRVMEAETPEAIRSLLTGTASEYWEEHFIFGRPSPRKAKSTGARALSLIFINTVVPFLYAYGRHKASDVLCERAGRLLEGLKAEDNHVIRMWSGAGIPVSNAADSQALLQLHKEYCEKKDCLRCRFGFEYLRGK